MDRNRSWTGTGPYLLVALRKESVDRNDKIVNADIVATLSLSARRAWIEMRKNISSEYRSNVALRKESVDRNQYLSGVMTFGPGRSPQGERG